MATPPYETVELDRAASTQDEVRRRAGGRPLLVTAARQTEGRGRSGAAWVAAPRALAASLGVRPSWPLPSWPLVTLAAGAAVVRSLDELAEEEGRAGAGGVMLKWPNDLMKNGSKVGGILTEAAGGLAVVGWGANLYWPDPPAGMAGLFSKDPGSGLAPALARMWADQLLEVLSGEASDWPREEYRRRCSTIGREITWSPDGRGRAVDVTPEGGLQVETPRGSITLTSGSVTEVRSSP